MKREEKNNGKYVFVSVSLGDKPLLTLEEAAICFNIGINKIREMSDDPGCSFVVFNGNKRLIKKWKLVEYLSDISTI